MMFEVWLERSKQRNEQEPGNVGDNSAFLWRSAAAELNASIASGMWSDTRPHDDFY